MKKNALFSSFLLLFTSLQMLSAQQKQEELASQMMGIWIVKDLDVIVREEHKNNQEAQKTLGITKSRLEIQRLTMANTFTIIFEKGAKFSVKPTQDNADGMKGIWRLEDNILHIEAEDSPFMALMQGATIFFRQEKLYLCPPVPSGNQMSGVPEWHIPCFVLEKGTPQDIENAKQTFSNIPEETIYISKVETLIVHPKKAKCQVNEVESCLQIKHNEKADWEYLPNSIEGFDYKEGYEYVIKVKILQDASNLIGKYTLLKTLSKTKKR